MYTLDANNETPWYREFWPWFVMAIPAWAVIAGIITVSVAVAHKDSLVTDDYYKAGITINKALAELDLADTLGIKAVVRPVQQRLLSLQLDGEFAPQGELLLAFRHPTLAQRDFTIRLHPQGSGHYTGLVEPTLEGRWQVVLSPQLNVEPRWRVEGTWRNPTQQGLTLGSAGAAHD